jgi:hypothetical protein
MIKKDHKSQFAKRNSGGKSESNTTIKKVDDKVFILIIK